MGTDHNAHTRRSGRTAAEPAMLAQYAYRAAESPFGFVLVSSMRPSVAPAAPGKLRTAHLHARQDGF